MIEIENDLNETNSNKNTIDKDSTTDESSESSFSAVSPRQLKSVKKTKFSKKKFSDICYALNLYEKYGSLIVEELDSKIFFLSKIQMVNFSASKELFDKGKNSSNNEYNEEIESVPDISFWHQRYYYYSLFDEGIKMDNESKLYSIFFNNTNFFKIKIIELLKYQNLFFTNFF